MLPNEQKTKTSNSKMPIDLVPMLQADGLEVAGYDPNSGVAKIIDPTDGSENEFDIKGYLASKAMEEGIEDFDFSKVTPVLSTRDNPIPQSPFGLIERLALDFGNNKGNLEKLKTQGLEPEYVEGKGLTVKKDGNVYEVDPSLFSDPWSVTEQLNDVAEMTPEAIELGTSYAGGLAGAAKGGAVGFAMAGPPGALIGATVGGIGGRALGAGAGKIITTSLGRAFNTYVADPLEQTKDVGMEILYSLGGDAILPGMKLAKNQVVKGFSKVGEAVPDALKDTFFSGVDLVYSAPSGAAKALFTRTGEIMSKVSDITKDTVKELRKNGTSSFLNFSDQAQKIAKIQVEDKLIQIGREGDAFIKNKFSKDLVQIMKDVDSPDKRLHGGEIFSRISDAVKETGLAKFVTKQGRDLSKVLDQFGNPIPITASKKGVWEPLSNDEIQEVISKNIQARMADPNTKGALTNEILNVQHFKMIEPMLKSINKLGEIGERKGAEAFDLVMQVRKDLDNAYDILVENSPGPISETATRLYTGLKVEMDNVLTDQFSKFGPDIGNRVAKLTDNYRKVGGALSEFRRIRDSGGFDPEVFTNKYLSKTGNTTAQTFVDDMAEVLGDRGQAMVQDTMNTIYAGQWMRRMPKLPQFVSGALAGLGSGAATVGAPAILPGIVAGMTLTSPAVARNIVGQTYNIAKKGQMVTNWTLQNADDILKTPEGNILFLQTLQRTLRGDDEAEAEQEVMGYVQDQLQQSQMPMGQPQQMQE